MNILTLQEALRTIKTDNDYDGEIEETLPEIDQQIFLATGIWWNKRPIIEPLAKTLAKIKLRLILGYSTNPEQDKAREIYCAKQLQALAGLIDAGYADDEEEASNFITADEEEIELSDGSVLEVQNEI